MWMDTHPKRRQEQANNSLFIIYRKHWKKIKSHGHFCQDCMKSLPEKQTTLILI